jgi:hypothetical protein
LLGDIASGGARDLDPNLREDGARKKHKGDIEECVEGVTNNVHKIAGRRDVVSETTNWGRVSSHVILLPFSEKVHEEVTAELLSENLREEVEVGDESSLEDDRNVGGVEELDGVWLLVSFHFAGRNGKLNAEALYHKFN